MGDVEPDNIDQIEALGPQLLREVIGELVLPPVSAPTACRICRGSVLGLVGGLCEDCLYNREVLEAELQPLVALSLYRRPSLLRDCLAHYKASSEHPANPRLSKLLGQLVQRFLVQNRDAWNSASEHCQGLVVVPSTVPRGQHPLEEVLRASVLELKIPVVQLLERTAEPLGHNHPCRGAFRVKPLLGVSNVILLDDVYTTGARAQSASYALRKAGVNVVALVAIGRRYNLDFDEAVSALWEESAQRPFAWDLATRLEGVGP